ncbi:MAG: DEAD/DEAH box helicase, partial [Planctomycetota bacterium]
MIRGERREEAAEVLERLQRRVAGKGEVREIRAIPAREARHAAEPPPLDERILHYLEERGTWPLYRHQGEAIERVLEGEHVVVASSTASGKTWCYNLPVLDAVLRGDNAYALYLFPTKALAQDQYRALTRLIDGLGIRVEAGIYDGDTEPE